MTRSKTRRVERAIGAETSARASGDDVARAHARSLPAQAVTMRSRPDTACPRDYRVPFPFLHFDRRPVPRHDDRVSLRHGPVNGDDLARLDEHGLPGLDLRRALGRPVGVKDARAGVEGRSDLLPGLADLAPRARNRGFDRDADRGGEPRQGGDRCRVRVAGKIGGDGDDARSDDGKRDEERARVGEIAGHERQPREQGDDRDERECEPHGQAHVRDREERNEETGDDPRPGSDDARARSVPEAFAGATLSRSGESGAEGGGGERSVCGLVGAVSSGASDGPDERMAATGAGAVGAGKAGAGKAGGPAVAAGAVSPPFDAWSLDPFELAS